MYALSKHNRVIHVYWMFFLLGKTLNNMVFVMLYMYNVRTCVCIGKLT